jgi:hypothetical protein
MGREILQRDMGNAERGDFTFHLGLENLVPGLYLMKIQMNSGSGSLPFVKH